MKILRERVTFYIKESIRFTIGIISSQVHTLLSPIYVSGLNIKSYGMLELIFSLIGFITIFMGMGLSQLIGIRFYKEKNSTEAAIKAALIYIIIITPLCILFSVPAIGTITATFIFNDTTSYPIFVLLVWVAYLMFFKTFMMSLLVISYHSSLYMIFEFISALLFAGMIYLVWKFWNLSVPLILGINIVGLTPIIFLIVHTLRQKDYLPKLHRLLKEVEFFKTLKVSIPLVGYGLCNWAVNLADRFLLLKIGNHSEEIAMYSLSYRLTNILPAFVSTIFGVLYYRNVYASLSKFVQKSPEALIHFNKKNIKLSYIFAVFYIFTFILYYYAIIGLFPFFYPKEYTPSFIVMPYLLIGFFAQQLNNFYILPLMFLEQTSSVFNIYFLGMLINIIINILLIPDYGMKGAAVATAITFAMIMCATIITSKSTLKKYCIKHAIGKTT